MNWHRRLLLLDKSPVGRLGISALAVGLIPYVFHILKHNCMDGHLAHDPVPYSTALDFSWWALFSSALVATLFIKAPKYGFYALFTITILLSEILLITAPLVVLFYYLLIRKEKAPNQTPEPTPTAVTPDADASVAPSAGAAHL